MFGGPSWIPLLNQWSSHVLAVKPYSLCRLLLHFILGPGWTQSRPWQRVHIDFAGPFRNKNFLIVVDAHSKWPEVIPDGYYHLHSNHP